MASLHVVGVRHHSPACARLVRSAMDAVRPDVVLIEGPSDMNDRVDELGLAHRPPIAVFSHFARGRERRASWTPFTDFSPEWVALREGLRRGAAVRFIDLPAWAVDAPRAPRRRAGAAYLRALCRRLGVDGYDALWDELFELAPREELSDRLEAYFAALRAADGPRPSSERAREAFMLDHVAYAMSHAEAVLVVCGGLHAPALARWASRPVPRRVPRRAPPEDAVSGSYLVPYSFDRLDAHRGGGGGIPSPGYYQALWERGAQDAADWMIASIVRALRGHSGAVSTAELVSAEAATRALTRLRGHAAPARVDVLDGFATAVLDEALEAPLPWTARADARRAHPRARDLLRAIGGERVGALDPTTPRPPLLDDAAAALRAHDVSVEADPREVVLDLTRARERDASRVLNRLRVLGVAGFERGARSDDATRERWRIHRAPEAEAQLAEASAWGADLEAAAEARLAARWEDRDLELPVFVEQIEAALDVGFDRLGHAAARAARRVARGEPRLSRLGPVAARLLHLRQHDPRLADRDAASLDATVRALLRRAVWLLSAARGAERASDPGELVAVAAMRDALRSGEALLDRAPTAQAALGVVRRGDAPPALRGAALGLLWDMAPEDEPPVDPRALVEACGRPTTLGEVLTGLFAVAREAFVREPALIAAIDAIVAGWDERELLVALPSLRLAFSYFPPRERDRIARAVLSLHGRPLPLDALRVLPAAAETIARGARLERLVDDALARYGLEGER